MSQKPELFDRYMKRTSCVFFGALTATLLFYRLYGAVFPFSRAAAGVCRHCGAQTLLRPGAWASFCPSHTPLFGIIQVVVILLEAVFMLAVTSSFWLMIRKLAYWGGRDVSRVLAIFSIIAVAIFVVQSRHALMVPQQFTCALGILFFVLSAVYVDSLESIVIMALVAIVLAAVMALVFQILSWVLIGYLNIVPGTAP